MDDPRARALFEDNAALLQDAKIMGGSLDDDRLVLQIDAGFPDGRFALEVTAKPVTVARREPEARLEIDFDEPAGAGTDPYGRPDPRTHPEYWRE